MKLGFGFKRLWCNFTGLGSYSRSLVKNLKNFYPENQCSLYTPKLKTISETAFLQDGLSFQTYKAKTVFESFWRRFSIINQLKKEKIKLYHGLSNELPNQYKNNRLSNKPKTVNINKAFYNLHFNGLKRKM